ncbi:MAG: efflux RND transporter periplasmic adaptor subunit [Opitutaceae bacterium]
MNKLFSKLQLTSNRQRGILLAGAFVVGLLIIGGCRRSNNVKAEEQVQLDRYYTVEKGDFNITVLARGELDAIKNHELKFEGTGRLGLRIEYIVADKSKVKAGDPVVTFADEKYEEEIMLLEQKIYDRKVEYENRLIFEEDYYSDSMRSQEEKLDDAVLNLSLFLETQALARDKSFSNLTEASNAYETALDALNKYENLDYRTESRQKLSEIDNKEQEYLDAIDERDKADQELSEARLKDEDTRDKAERKLNLAEKKVDNAMVAWENARKADRQFRRYDHPQKLRQLSISTEKTALNLKRSLVNEQSERVQSERRYRALLRDRERIDEKIEELQTKYTGDLERLAKDYETDMARNEEQLAILKSDNEQLILRAPIDGIVSLGDNRSRDRGSQGMKVLEIGTSVSPREVVARIPDLSKFLVQCDIPEVYRSRISVGQTTLLKNAALPGLKMTGQIESIATMSQRLIRWDSRSPRIYETRINTNTTDPRLAPGMTVEVEILVDKVKGVLFIPIEAVYNKEGKSYCKVKTSFSTEEVEVTTGRSSNSYVEILKGLEPEDVVLLHGSAASNQAN